MTKYCDIVSQYAPELVMNCFLLEVTHNDDDQYALDGDMRKGILSAVVAKNYKGKDYLAGLIQMLEDPPVVTDDIKHAVASCVDRGGS